MGPPDWLVERVREHFGITTFVETGGYLGDTAAWAASKWSGPFAAIRRWPASAF